MTLKAERITFGHKRHPIQNERSNASSATQAYINDLGRNVESISAKGDLHSKTEWADLLAVARDWYAYGRIKITYTWTDATTTDWYGFVDTLNFDQAGGEPDIWSWSLGFVIGVSRS